MTHLEMAKDNRENYENQINRDRLDQLTEERRYRQVMMDAAIAQAAALERIAKVQDYMQRIEWNRE